MKASQLKKEIMGIIKFEGVPMSSNEIWEVMTIDGQEGIERKLFTNSLTTLVTGEYLEKVPDEEKLNRYRYITTKKGEDWIAKKANETAPEKPDQELKQNTKPEPLDTGNEIKLDKTVFDELYMVYMPGMVAKICESLPDAKAQASEFIAESGVSTSIHRIYSEPVFECRPVTTIEFKEVL